MLRASVFDGNVERAQNFDGAVGDGGGSLVIDVIGVANEEG